MASTVPLWRRPVTYGAIGATKADDILTFPPRGFRASQRRVRIGHGDNRFNWAVAQTMSWGLQRRSGFDVEVQDAPAAVTDNTYVPVSFDTAGIPLAEAGVTGSTERTYGPDGVSFLVPGDSAVLRLSILGVRVPAPVRVVYVIDEPDRKGFAYGSLPGHPESGEESFLVERTDDGSVWLTVTAFSRPSTWYWRMLAVPLLATQRIITRRYLRALSGPID